jgi:peptidoglycan/LPS O-acetylase OafA/YrhL
VNLFFILSAFLLALPFLAMTHGGRPVSLRRYTARRALRILPLYYAAVVVAALVLARQPADVLRGMPYLFFLNTFGEYYTTPLLPFSNVWWSLATEAQFYVLLPLLPLFLRSARGRLCGVLVVLAWAVAYAAFLTQMLRASSITGHIALGISLFGRLPLFLFGIGGAALYLRRGGAIRAWLARSPLARGGGADLLLIGVLVLLAYLLRWVTWIGAIDEKNPPYHAWHLAEGALWTLVVLLVVLAPLRLKGLLDNRVFRHLGTVSYSIYIVHIPVIVYTLALVGRGGGPAGWNARVAAVAAAITAISVLLAETTYRLVEQPFLRRKESLRG